MLHLGPLHLATYRWGIMVAYCLRGGQVSPDCGRWAIGCLRLGWPLATWWGGDIRDE